MVTIWHSALKLLSKILREKNHQHIKNDICLKKVFLEKPMIAFRKKKSIRNYIVIINMNEANKQKIPKIMTTFSLCRNPCHLINSHNTLKNTLNGKEIKKLDRTNCRKANIVYAARCKINGDIYIGNTGEELRERFDKHKSDTKNRPDNNEIPVYIHKYQRNLFTVKGNLHQKHEKELREDKLICLLGTKALTGLNIELKHYGRVL